MSQRAEIIARIASIPPLPSASAEVVRLVCDPAVPSAKVAQAIEYDPSLTTNVLRLANSTSFGAPQSVGTVREAFSRLVPDKGLKSVLAAAFGRIAERPMTGYDVSGEDLWDHLIGSAIASMRLAHLLKISPHEHLFTAALTHDIGKVVLGTFTEVDPKTIVSLALEERISFEKAEQRVLGIDHAEVGAFLVEHWSFPMSIVEAVRWHHEPESRVVAEPLIVGLVHVADAVCLMAGVGASIDALSYRPSSQTMARLGLQMSLLDKIVYEVLNELLKVRTLFKFPQGCPQ